MAGEWQSSRLGDLVAHQKGFAFKSADYRPIGHPIVRVSNFTDGSIDMADCSYLDHDGVQQYEAYKLRHRDAVIATVGSWPTNPASVVGKTVSVPEKADGALLNQNAVRLRTKGDLDQRFLFYLLKQPDFQTYIIGTAQGSASQASITLKDIFGFEFHCPPLAQQKAIAAVFGALDDKIELNRRMNATLETMARALFQSWFVDFDPVRAKLDGRQPPGIDVATAALFPNEFKDSELGPIPKGWKAGSVVEEFNLTMGQSPPGNTYNEEGRGIPLYQGKTDLGFRFPTRRIFCTAPTRYAKAGDTLVSVRAPVGDINMANEECCVGRGVAAVRHKTGARSFTYYSMSNLYPDFARFEAEGTVFGSINKQSFENLPFVIPPAEAVASYERLAAPLDEQICILEHQSRTLATLRDTLLPKLLSGQMSASLR